MEAMAAPEDMSCLVDLLRHELSVRFDDGAEVALSWCPASALNRAAYRQAGFFHLPERFRPVEFHFGVKSFDREDRNKLASTRSWYLSYLDSDTI